MFFKVISVGVSEKSKCRFVSRENSLREIKQLIEAKKQEILSRGEDRPIFIVIDGDSCVGKSCFSRSLGEMFRSHIIEKDKLVRSTTYLVGEEDPYVVWGRIMAFELKNLIAQRDKEIFIIEGIYSLDVVRNIEETHGIKFDIRISIQANQVTRERIFMRKVNNQDFEYVNAFKRGEFKKFLDENRQDSYSMESDYDFMVDNSDSLLD